MKKILSLVLSLMMVLSLVGCSSENKVVATVNGKEITLGNYERLLALNKSSMEAYYGSDIWSSEVEEGKTYEDTLREMVLESMTSSEVIYQQAEKEKVAPTDKEVQEQIDSFNQNIKDDEDYKKELKRMGIDDKFLKYQFARDIANQNLKTHYEDNTKVSESDMKKYYEDNKDDFYVDTVTASHILIKTQDDNGKELSDEEKSKAKKTAEEVLAKIKAGEDFAKLAKEYSQDSSASNGGELGTFGRGQMVQEFEDASFSMKAGEVSDIVKTQYGYHIIKVTERVNKQESYDESKATIKSTLLSEKYTEYIEGLVDKADIKEKEDIVKSAKF